MQRRRCRCFYRQLCNCKRDNIHEEVIFDKDQESAMVKVGGILWTIIINDILEGRITTEPEHVKRILMYNKIGRKAKLRPFINVPYLIAKRVYDDRVAEIEWLEQEYINLRKKKVDFYEKLRSSNDESPSYRMNFTGLDYAEIN